MRLRFSCMIIAPILLAGCMKTPERNMLNGFIFGEAYVSQSANTAEVSEEIWNTAKSQAGWWTLYEDEELNTLMHYAFNNSPTLAQIRSRLAQAGAFTDQSKANLLPSIDASVERSTQNGTNRNPSDFSVNGAASFEVDLWQKNRLEVKSDEFEEQATLEDLYAAHITLSASIVENWLEILSLLEQEDLIKKQIEVNQTVLDLQKKRFEMGAASALDILQQEETLAASESQLPDILSAKQQAANNIALLLGEFPQDGLRITKKAFPSALPLPDTGLPSDLLANRPDIIAAWLRILSSDWAAQAAWANRLPQFDISALFTSTATRIDTLFDSWLLDLAAGLSAPIFDGGAREAEQIRQEAIADERVHAYRETVLTAVNEVENALVRNVFTDRKIASLEKQLSASKRTLEQAQISYTNGDSGYINVLNSLNSSQALEQQILSAKLTQAQERVALYRALGGRSWLSQIVKTENSTSANETSEDKI